MGQWCGPVRRRHPVTGPRPSPTRPVPGRRGVRWAGLWRTGNGRVGAKSACRACAPLPEGSATHRELRGLVRIRRVFVGGCNFLHHCPRRGHSLCASRRQKPPISLRQSSPLWRRSERLGVPAPSDEHHNRSAEEEADSGASRVSFSESMRLVQSVRRIETCEKGSGRHEVGGAKSVRKRVGG
jgi:hypothetical protein